MAKRRQKSAAPIYAAGAVWLVWAAVLPLYRPTHYVLAAAASLAVYLVGRMCIWKDRVILLPDPEPKDRPEAQKQAPPEQKAKAEPAHRAEPDKAPEKPQDPEVAALLAERARAVGEMRRLNDSIEDPVISAQIDHLEEITGKILPTTLKILNAYDRMDAAGVSGANIDGTKGKIETMMTTLVSAFDKQLDALFGEEALDISTDITVLEQMLAREGLGGTPLHSEP